MPGQSPSEESKNTVIRHPNRYGIKAFALAWISAMRGRLRGYHIFNLPPHISKYRRPKSLGSIEKPAKRLSQEPVSFNICFLRPQADFPFAVNLAHIEWEGHVVKLIMNSGDDSGPVALCPFRGDSQKFPRNHSIVDALNQRP